jgi:DNA processing protein
MEDILVYFSYIHDGNWEKIYSSIENKERVDFEEVKKVVASIKCKYVTMLSKEYPERLKHIYKPPFVLYYYGDLDVLDNRSLGVIGSRNNSEYGKKMTERIVSELGEKSGITIVSGMAKGIDSIATNVGLSSNMKCVGVLGCGLDCPLDTMNVGLYDRLKKEGLIISEYPPSSYPSKEKFPLRNRILAGLSDKLLVVEARLKSGTMITVGCALDQGKDVMCVPSRADVDSGCNYLIKQGAILVESGKDILNMCG